LDSFIELTDAERRALELYRQPSGKDMRRMLRLSVQYALGAGIFTALALVTRQPAYVAVVYAIFLAYLGVRINGARKLAGLMPGIVAKYDQELAELRRKLAAFSLPKSTAALQCCFCHSPIAEAPDQPFAVTFASSDGSLCTQAAHAACLPTVVRRQADLVSENGSASGQGRL